MIKKEPGSLNVKEIKNSINGIETLTNAFKRKRISTDQYIKGIEKCLSNLNSERDYEKYLKNLGQW